MTLIDGWEVHDGALRFGRVPRPEPAAGETLVRIALAGVCGSDVAKLTKAVIPDPGYPWRPGHEIVGTDPSGVPVAVNPMVPCESCDRCGFGRIDLCPSLRLVGWQLPGGFAEYVAVPAANVVPLPAGVAPAHGVLADPAAVAVHGVRCGLRHVRPGRLAVVGSGAVAVATAAYATHAGWEATVLVRSAEKLAALPGMAKPLAEAPPRSYDAVVDAASGRDDSPLVSALDLVRDGGTIVVQTAYYPGVRLTRDLREPIRRAVTIAGSFTYCGDDFAVGLDLLADRPAWADVFTGDLYPLAGLREALAALAPPGVGGAPAGVGRRPAKAVLVTGSEI